MIQSKVGVSAIQREQCLTDQNTLMFRLLMSIMGKQCLDLERRKTLSNALLDFLMSILSQELRLKTKKFTLKFNLKKLALLPILQPQIMLKKFILVTLAE